MIALIIYACLIADPEVCEDHQIPVLAATSPTICALHAPPHFARWSAKHPGWTIKSWRCGAMTFDGGKSGG